MSLKRCFPLDFKQWEWSLYFEKKTVARYSYSERIRGIFTTDVCFQRDIPLKNHSSSFQVGESPFFAGAAFITLRGADNASRRLNFDDSISIETLGSYTVDKVAFQLFTLFFISTWELFVLPPILWTLFSKNCCTISTGRRFKQSTLSSLVFVLLSVRVRISDVLWLQLE